MRTPKLLLPLLAILAFWPLYGGLAAVPASVPLVAETPNSGFNRLTVSVTVCSPGSERCVTIPHIMVDTGSVGLRLQAHAVPDGLDLPLARNGSGQVVAECLRFVGAAAWGALHRADVRMGGLIARDIPVQVVGDELPRPGSCPGGGHPTSNGTLGIGLHATDCGGNCVQSEAHPGYLACAGAACAPYPGPVPLFLQLPQPLRRFGTDNNGVMLDMPMPAHHGEARVEGRLLFGLGTNRDNGFGGASIIRLSARGRVSTEYAGRTATDSYFDSGTQSLIVPDDRLPICPGGHASVCLRPAVRTSATVVGADGSRTVIPFLVGEFPRPGEHGVFAGAVSVARRPDLFVWGFPFFIGRRVGLLFAGETVPGRPDLVGPLYVVGPRGGS
ncbi:DUF3443 family protein [Rhizosaccharibacter radicis]|uniref:DUF3443 domain-containing protein n=1 Tax=Rhizosaccharibacter radicis TaxID=2782605 RepID=A0ABT1VTG9_9PROT|nr:DUF3443 domain-containing protein [Acetobacteraceae bacterium KSS12]